MTVSTAAWIGVRMGRHIGQHGRLENSEGFRHNIQHGRLKWSEHDPSLWSARLVGRERGGAE